MPLDYNSLLLAIGFAGACLTITLFATWLSARTEGFLLTWSIGGLLLVGSVFAYSAYVQKPLALAGFLALAALMLGFSVVYAAAFQFREGYLPLARIGGLAAASITVVVVPFALGYDGLGFIAENLAAALLLLATAHQYWIGRAEAPGPIIGLSLLHAVTGLSFVLCAAVLIVNGELKLGRAPDNWAENVNLAVSIAALAGIGALSLALNQWRLAQSHRRDALTDAQTGLLNRRALFDAHSDVAAETSVIVFDLDGFKGINDRFGHAVGDEVLARFAAAIKRSVRDTDTAARLGGEEFAVVLPGSTAEMGAIIAERIRAVFAGEVVETDKGVLKCTVSAGVIFVAHGGQSLDEALSLADNALYLAKRDGRNRVVSHGLRLVS